MCGIFSPSISKERFCTNKKHFYLQNQSLSNTDIVEKSTEFGLIAEVLTEAVEDVLWNTQDGIWYDFDFESGKPRNYFAPSNLVPLWTETFRPENKAEISARAVNYLYKQNFNVFPGMYVATTTETCLTTA